MQVTHVADNITHAVIGNNKAMDFGISNSAEFFNILSNTLYSDKKLAVIREVLCNAWDIHIQTERTDTPVQVTLTSDRLTIRDFGTGISPEDMHPIYAIYGNSTKKLDGHQTGGFGLGSKAPFAYVDHFEVTSFHVGKKTIYAVSKSSAEVAGKPSITPLVSVPCGSETGLMVSMAILPGDISSFRQIIETIARFGEMNVELNGAALPTLPFSEAKHGFMMIKNTHGLSGHSNTKIFIRYGNVVYPISTHEKFYKVYESVSRILRKIGNHNSYGSNRAEWSVIFQAKPNTISVTPSRESLSMTDHTVQTISDILEQFKTLVTNQMEAHCIDLERETIAEIWKSGKVGSLLNSNNSVPTLFETDMHGQPKKVKILAEPEVISDVRGISQSYMHRSYPDFKNFRAKDMEMRFEALEKANYGGKYNRGKLQDFRRLYAQKGNADETVAAPWFQRRIVQPLIRKIDDVPELSSSKLMIYGMHQSNTVDKHGYRRYGRDTCFTQATKLSPRNLEGYIPFLRNFVVLSFNRIDVEERLPKFPIMKDTLGKAQDMFVYIISRTDKKVEIARKFFTDLGMTLVDLTKVQAWETPHVIVPVPKPKLPVKPRKKGLPKLSELLRFDISGNPNLNYSRFTTSHADYENLARIETPEFVVKINPRQQIPTLYHNMPNSLALNITRAYGHLGGVALNDNQYHRFNNELKIPGLIPWLYAKLKQEVENNPRIQFMLGAKIKNFASVGTSNLTSQQRQVFNVILDQPDVAIEFGILNEMTQEDRLILSIMKEIRDAYYWHHHIEGKHLQTVVENIKPSPEVVLLANRISSSKLIQIIDAHQLSAMFNKPTPTPEQKKRQVAAMDILLYAIEG